jgi:hypothetical protein
MPVSIGDITEAFEFANTGGNENFSPSFASGPGKSTIKPIFQTEQR